MKRFEIKLINIGRKDYNETMIRKLTNINEAVMLAYEECNKHLMSNNTSLHPVRDDEELWRLQAGFHTVGKVRIKEVEL